MRETLVAKFDVTGSLRFISHQEMLRVWQRALIRAGVPMCFSEGFNPHPRISLPLPRSVGLEAADEIVCVCIERPENEPLDVEKLRAAISEQMPGGCSLLDVELRSSKASVRAEGRNVFLPAEPSEKLRAAAGELLSRIAASERITVDRRVDDSGRSRTVDVTEYIKAIHIEDNGVSIECRISPAGSIRVDEITKLLQIDVLMLTGAVRRTSVRWLEKN